ncbi:MAG: autotransporter outer membrane beta-barrel domain-containing protein [Planctomycetaceae bacterium]|nr:autotransporter outer membrane beta-barrel domain-containing protein [Planctomycetaceae bacterium]
MSETIRIFSVRYFLTAVLSAVLVFSVSGVPVQAQTLPDGLNPYSDIVPAGITIANRKVYRQAFSELARDRSYYGYQQEYGVQAQVPTSKTFHVEFVGRGTEIQPNEPLLGLPLDKYGLQSYGFRAGGLIRSTPCDAFGIVFGYERGFFRNEYNLQNMFAPYRDDMDLGFPEINDYTFIEERNSTRFDDYCFGVYYGKIIQKDVEFRSYIGGEHLRHNTKRNDQNNAYNAVYEGSNFELNLELSRSIRRCPQGVVFRPYIGVDVEHTMLEAGTEQNIGTLFRYYERTYLSQLFMRLGLDLEKRWRRLETHGGIGLTTLMLGNTCAKTNTLYPAIDGGIEYPISTTRLGRFSLNFKAGGNLYLNQARTQSLYVEYFADIHTDRTGSPAVHTGSFGYAVRY